MAESITGAIQWAVSRCADPNVQYSQTYREEQTIDGITYYDCSSFIWFALKHNGWDMAAMTGHSYAWTTASMPQELPLAGFQQVLITGEWKPGDIVWRSGHCEMVYSGGSGSGVTMGAHDHYPSDTQRDVSINNYTSTYSEYTSLWRYSGEIDLGRYCWMGWTNFESYYDYDDPRGLYVIQTTGEAYGRYQFDYQYGLVPFMQYCVQQDPSGYSGFNQYIALGPGNSQLINNAGLHQLFEDYTNRNFDQFQNFQDVNGIEEYLDVALSYMSWTPTDPVVLGSLFSMAIRAGAYPAAQCFPASAGTPAYVIQYAYANMSQLHYDSGRWVAGGGSQYDAAMAALGSGADCYWIPWGYRPQPRYYPWKWIRRKPFTAIIRKRRTIL